MTDNRNFPDPPFHEPRAYYDFRIELGGRLAARYATSDMMGLMGQDVVDIPPAITDIYVPLKLHEELLDKEEREERKDILTVGSALTQMKRLAISGPPGSGKSTLVRFLAHGLGRRRITPLAAEVGRRLPVPVILRAMDLNKMKDSDQFLDAWCAQTGRDLEMEIEPEKLRWYLEKGWCVLLFDGVDELGEANRKKLRDKIIYPLCKTYPENTVIVTGRPNGFSTHPYKFPDSSGQKRGPLLQVQPFDEEDIVLFSQKWFACREPNKTRAEELHKIFIPALQANSSLREMKSRPVFLTMLAVVHEATGRLPDTRAEAYRAILKTYIDQLDAVRMKTLREDPEQAKELVPPWAEEDKKRILEKLAYTMHLRALEKRHSKPRFMILLNSPRILISREEMRYLLREIINDIAAKQPNFSLKQDYDRDPERLVDQVFAYFVARTGFLVESVADHFQFSHLSIQEYLTALHIYRGQLEGKNRLAPIAYLRKELTERMTSDLWHEVGILFFCHDALEGGGDQDDLLGALLPKEMNDGLITFWVKLLGNREHQISKGYRDKATSTLVKYASKAKDLQALHDTIYREWNRPPSDAWSTIQKGLKGYHPNKTASLARLLFLCLAIPDIREEIKWPEVVDWLAQQWFPFNDLVVILDLFDTEVLYPQLHPRIPLDSDLLHPNHHFVSTSHKRQPGIHKNIQNLVWFACTVECPTRLVGDLKRARNKALKVNGDLEFRDMAKALARNMAPILRTWAQELVRIHSMDIAKDRTQNAVRTLVRLHSLDITKDRSLDGARDMARDMALALALARPNKWAQKVADLFGSAAEATTWSQPLQGAVQQASLALAFYPEIEGVTCQDIRQAQRALVHPAEAYPRGELSAEAYAYFLEEHARVFGPGGSLHFLLKLPDPPEDMTPITWDHFLKPLEAAIAKTQAAEGAASDAD